MRALPLLFLASFSAAAAAPNWTSVPSKPITLFAPGQTSLEWLMTPGEHKGADRFRAGARQDGDAEPARALAREFFEEKAP